MARGTIALIAALFALSALVIVVVSAVVLLTGALQGVDAIQLIWLGFLHTIDSGEIGNDTGSVPFIVGMLAVTLGGIFIASVLIGVITSGIQGKLEELRKGRSRVLESGHVVLLGWSPEVFDIVSELVLANANKGNQRIVVLADRDKVAMEEAIRQRVPNTLTTRVVCRTGSPIDLADLCIASLPTSRAIIVLAPPSDDPDTEVIKTLLAITNDPDRRPDRYRIVAEIREPRNVDVANLASRSEAQIVLGGDLIARIAAQACRQPGLSVVYQDLLDFGGDEMYFWSSPELVGRKFGECLVLFRNSSLIGIAPADGNGAPQLNPPMDRIISEDDRLVFISEDDDTIVLDSSTDRAPREDLIVATEGRQQEPESTLVLGWNSRTAGLITELDKYVAPGSRLTVVADAGVSDASDEIAKFSQMIKQQAMTYVAADTTARAVLDEITRTKFDHVVVMSYSDTLDQQRADARTLVTLLHLRDIESRSDQHFTIVSEMLDVRNRALAQVTSADDFIVSGKLVSLMMSQLAENPDLRPIFDDMFDEEGSEIYLKPVGDYVAVGEKVNFYTLTESARRRGQVALGYRLVSLADQSDKNYGVELNPDKAAMIKFGADDKLIVISAN